MTLHTVTLAWMWLHKLACRSMSFRQCDFCVKICESWVGMGLKSFEMTASRLLEGLTMSSLTVVGARLLETSRGWARESLQMLWMARNWQFLTQRAFQFLGREVPDH